MKVLNHDYAGHAFPVQLSRELARRGHEVVHAYAGGLLTPRGPLERQPGDPDGFSSVEVPMSAGYRKHKYHFAKRRQMEAAYGAELERLFENVRPDLVISGNTPSEPQWRLLRAAARLRIPSVNWLQDIYSLAVSQLARKKWPVLGAVVGRYYRYLDHRCLRASSEIVAITADFAPIVSELEGTCRDITVIPNWAPVEELPVRSRHNSWAIAHHLADRFVFLYAGTLAMKHDPDTIRRLAESFRADTDVRFVVVSEGPGAEYLLQRKLSDSLERLLVLPYQPFSQMPEVMGTADVLLATLEDDAGIFSVPSKILTYHCAERAILAAIPEQNLAARLIRENSTGWCVRPRDHPDILHASQILRIDSERRRTMGRNARAYAEKTFHIGAITDSFERVFARAIARSKPGRSA